LDCLSPALITLVVGGEKRGGGGTVVVVEASPAVLEVEEEVYGLRVVYKV
jgi:hypothetical protein